MFCGADTERLRDVATMIGDCSSRTAARLEDVTAAVLSASWEGADADRFRQEFSGPVSESWRLVVDLLRERAVEIRTHADEQDSASDEAGPIAGGMVAGTAALSARMGGNRTAGAGSPGDGSPVAQEADRDGGTDPVPSNPDGSIDGPEPYPESANGLGPGVPGTTADVPEPPAWSPADSGSGEWNSREPTDEDRETEDLAELLIAGGRVTGKGPASDNLQHYLDNTGEDKPIDVDNMLEEVPSFADEVDEQRRSIGQEAISQAQESGATGPVTFPVNTDWEGGGAAKDESAKYYYATASFDYNQTGTVTAYPPTEPGGEWTYEMDTAVNVRDRYNWDTGKGVTIPAPDWVPGIPDGGYIPDTRMQGLHESGLAREYNIVGASETSRSSGP